MILHSSEYKLSECVAKNEHKTRQLQELAKINGTLRDRSWGTGGSSFGGDEVSYDRADVKCAICGDASHPTSDCSLKGRAHATGYQRPKEQIDDEYEKFLSEIGEKPAPSSATGDINDAYKEFMATLKSDGSSQPNPPPPTQSNNRPGIHLFSILIISFIIFICHFNNYYQ